MFLCIDVLKNFGKHGRINQIVGKGGNAYVKQN